MRTLVIILLSLVWGVNGYAQNTVLDHAKSGLTEYVSESLTTLDINGVTVIIKELTDQNTDSYGRNILAKAVYAPEYPNTYLIYVKRDVKKTLLAHEIIHIWQAYNGDPCNKQIIKCEDEADNKKGIIL